MSTFSMQWDQFGAGVAAVGSLGIAAFGVTEALGKAFAFTYRFGRGPTLHHWGLPYVGLGAVRKMAYPLRRALECAYGSEFAEIIAAQYRANRSSGSAPDTIRQGVRLGLPFLSLSAATDLIASVWHMSPALSQALARALQAPMMASPPVDGAAGATAAISDQDAGALAGRFASALDARIEAAFQLADERYETVAKTLAGLAALVLAATFKIGLQHVDLSWPLVIAIGLVAVPLAPVAKDLSTSLQSALTAFKSISGKAA